MCLHFNILCPCEAYLTSCEIDSYWNLFFFHSEKYFCTSVPNTLDELKGLPVILEGLWEINLP